MKYECSHIAVKFHNKFSNSSKENVHDSCNQYVKESNEMFVIKSCKYQFSGEQLNILPL